MQVGQSLVYDKRRPLRSVGRPILLDDIACDFPELKLIGIHIGMGKVDLSFPIFMECHVPCQ